MNNSDLIIKLTRSSFEKKNDFHLIFNNILIIQVVLI